MIRATLDTNIFVSAFNFGGLCSQIIDRYEAEEFILCLSQSMIDEVRRVLVEYFDWTSSDIAEIFDPLVSAAEVVTPKERIKACDDPDDDQILECAVEAEAHVIVTGDDDLLRMKRFRGIEILDPRTFLESKIGRS